MKDKSLWLTALIVAFIVGLSIWLGDNFVPNDTLPLTTYDKIAIVGIAITSALLVLTMILDTAVWNIASVGFFFFFSGVWLIYQRSWDKLEGWRFLQSNLGLWITRGFVSAGAFLLLSSTAYHLLSSDRDAKKVARKVLLASLLGLLVYGVAFWINGNATP